MGLLRGRICGSAITCLPFWYLWMVLEACISLSSSTCATPSSAACAAADSPAGPEPMMPTWYHCNPVRSPNGEDMPVTSPRWS